MENNILENNVKIETPVETAVRSITRSVLGIISAIILTVSVLLVSAFEFTYAFLLLPWVLLDLIMTCISFGAAKSRNIRCILNLQKVSSGLGFVFTAASLVLDYLSSYSYIKFDTPWYGISQGFKLPFNLLNTGFMPTMFLLPLTFFFIAKFVSLCSVAHCVKTNLPKRGFQIVAAVLMLLAFLGFAQDGLDRIHIIPSHYLYCGIETHNTIIMYTTGAVCLLTAVAALLEVIKYFKNFSKLRKTENAF